MKKFTKVCMIIALVTFSVGLLMCGVGALLGGFRQLEHINVRGLTGIPFRFVHSGIGHFQFGFWDDDWDDDWEEEWDLSSDEWVAVEGDGTESSDIVEDTGNAEDDTKAVVKGQGTGLTAGTIRGLELETGACKMYIRETDSDEVSLDISGECENHYQYRIKDGKTLLLVHKDMRYGENMHTWNSRHTKGNTEIYLYLPKAVTLDEIEIDFGAGKLDADYLRAREIEINAGAGKCNFAGLEASESVDISMGAGKITADALIAKEAKLDMAAGELKIDKVQISHDTEINMSMGSANLQGVLAGEVDVECSMGNLTLILEGAEEDYNYEIECGMGNVRIGDKSYNDLIDDYESYNGGGSKIDISCAMGTVDVNFTK